MRIDIPDHCDGSRMVYGMSYTANKIIENLYQGGYPPPGEGLKQAGVDVLVLCAREIQRADDYPGLIVVLAGGDDLESKKVLRQNIDLWKEASRQVADHVRNGRKVLVTCAAGKNRSGIVTAMALRELTGWAGQRIVNHIQHARPGALFNQTFVQYIVDSYPKRSKP